MSIVIIAFTMKMNFKTGDMYLESYGICRLCGAHADLDYILEHERTCLENAEKLNSDDPIETKNCTGVAGQGRRNQEGRGLLPADSGEI